MKVYVKILLSFLLVLMVCEILIFGVFVMVAGRIFHSRYERFTLGKVVVAKAFIEERMQSASETSVAANTALQDLIRFLGEAHEAKIWLEDPDYGPLIQSFSGPVPSAIAKQAMKKTKKVGDISIYSCFREHNLCYTRTDIRGTRGDSLSLHILFQRQRGDGHGKYFALGLFLIGAVIALLVIPVSRRITRPLKSLQESALRIAGGNLSHRADVKGKDEIGELGRSFNTMADRLERMIRSARELTANVSHELRSPLARINVAAELIEEYLETPCDPRVLKRLGNIRTEIEELDALIDRILALSRLDIQRKPLQFEDTDLVSLVHGLLEKFKPGMERKQVRLVRRLAFDSPFACDREGLSSALSNLLDNAVKFTSEQGVITVEIASVKLGVEIRMTNTSPALPESDLKKIFDPFYRAKPLKASGSGLGLTIAEKIIRRHHGVIRADNSEDGLTITIFIPKDRTATVLSSKSS